MKIRNQLAMACLGATLSASSAMAICPDLSGNYVIEASADGTLPRMTLTIQQTGCEKLVDTSVSNDVVRTYTALLDGVFRDPAPKEGATSFALEAAYFADGALVYYGMQVSQPKCEVQESTVVCQKSPVYTFRTEVRPNSSGDLEIKTVAYDAEGSVLGQGEVQYAKRISP